MKKEIKNFIIIFLVLISSYIVFLTLTMSIDTSIIFDNVAKSLNKIAEEGINWNMFRFYSLGSAADNPTDTIMLNHTMINTNMGNLKDAMDMYGYARYWHGYLILLKPLLIFTDIQGIRMFNMFIFYSILVILLLNIYKKTNSYLFPLSILLGMILCYIYIIPISMQYLSVFMIAFISSILIINKPKYIHYILFITGSITNFFDFLTVPLITLGLPLIIYFFINKDDLDIKESVLSIVVLSMLWGLGYALTWISKWIIASVVLNRNIVLEGINSSLFRIGGDEIFVLDRREVYRQNISTYFYSKKLFITYVLVVLIAIIALFIKNKNNLYKIFPFIILAIYPFVWYFILANHSQIHYYMTYRNMMIFFVSLNSIIIICINELKNKV